MTAAALIDRLRTNERLERSRGSRRLLTRFYDDPVVTHRCVQCAGTGHGVPAVVGQQSPVSISYADPYVAVAVSGSPVGIDLAVVRPGDRWYYDGVLSAAEIALVAEMSPQHRHHAFLRLWTAKEAVLKMSGVGLSADPVTISLPGVLTGEPTGYHLTELALTADGEHLVGFLATASAEDVSLDRWGTP